MSKKGFLLRYYLYHYYYYYYCGITDIVVVAVLVGTALVSVSAIA